MLPELSALLDVLRAKGVTRFKGDLVLKVAERDCTMPIELTLGAALEVPPLTAETATEAPQADADTCRCGHPLTEHTNGLCLVGCDVEHCAPEEK